MCLGFRSAMRRSGPSDADVGLTTLHQRDKSLMVRFHSFETSTVGALTLIFAYLICWEDFENEGKGFKVAIVMGSKSDLDVMKSAAKTLEEFESTTK